MNPFKESSIRISQEATEQSFYMGYPLKGKETISAAQIDYLKHKLQDRNDIKPNAKDRMCFTLDLLMGLTENRSRMDIVDIGCNTGIFTRILAQGGNYVLGLDISPRKIEVAGREIKRLGNSIRFDVADATKDIHRYAAPASVDVCLCTEVLEHVPNYGDVIAQMGSIVKPGGWMLITVPNEGKVHDPGHINIFTPESLQSNLEAYGEVNFHTPPDTHPYLNNWLFATVQRK
ncbi:MAG: class I SAM-dependent methyltransferase [Candidatus Roizmanbacteria bacterium]|nr:class I SAM-dependent methyltransferase [Candidatus Roizmanbacteria bacterium]